MKETRNERVESRTETTVRLSYLSRATIDILTTSRFEAHDKVSNNNEKGEKGRTTPGWAKRRRKGSNANPVDQTTTQQAIPSHSKGKNAKGMRERKGMQYRTSRKRATMKVVAHFCFSYHPHAIIDDDGFPPSSTCPCQPNTFPQSSKEPEPAPHPSQATSPELHPNILDDAKVRQPNAVVSSEARAQRPHVEQHEALENQTPPCRMAWRPI